MDSLKSFSQSFAHRESNLHVLFSSSFLTLHLISAPSNNFPLNTCPLLHYRGMTKAQAIVCYHVSSTLAGPSQDLCHLLESSVSDELTSQKGTGNQRSPEPRYPELTNNSHAVLRIKDLCFSPFFLFTTLVFTISLKNQFGKGILGEKQIKFCY